VAALRGGVGRDRGALGVISAVTLRCVPLFTVRRVDEPRPLEETLDRFDELADGNDHFELFVFPYTDLALVQLSERGGFAPEPVARGRQFLEETLLENAALGAGVRAGRRFNRLIPAINRAFAGLVSPRVRVDHGHRVYATKRLVRFTEMEYAVPREHGADAARRVLELVRRRRLPVGFPIELRVVRGDDAFLSTAYGRDTAYVSVHQRGKRHYQSAATLRDRYPDWDRFQAVAGGSTLAAASRTSTPSACWVRWRPRWPPSGRPAAAARPP
jgi:L-gulono-1,4-lactone dehydrogenase